MSKHTPGPWEDGTVKSNNGVIHNGPGTTADWQYGEAITHWMPLPEAPK